jgi:hypothetical protein
MELDRKIGRNAPCPGGSGKKLKNCCYRKGHRRTLYYLPMSHGDWGRGADADPKVRKCWSDLQFWLDNIKISFDKFYVDTNGGTDAVPAQGVPLTMGADFDVCGMPGPMWAVFTSRGRRNQTSGGCLAMIPGRFSFSSADVKRLVILRARPANGHPALP